MDFNKRISKFLAAMTLSSCVISSFNDCVLGMESKKSDQKIVNDLSKKSDQEIVNKLSEKFRQLDISEYRSFLDIVNILTNHALNTNPEYYCFYEHGIKMGEILEKIKNMFIYSGRLEPLPIANLFNNDYIGYLTDELPKCQYTTLTIYNNDNADKLINFIFEQIIKLELSNSPATSHSMERLCYLLCNVARNVYIKWGPISKLYNQKMNLLKEKFCLENNCQCDDCRNKIRLLTNEIQTLEQGITYALNEAKCALCKKNVNKNCVLVDCCDAGHIAHEGCFNKFAGKYHVLVKCPMCNK